MTSNPMLGVQQLHFMHLKTHVKQQFLNARPFAISSVEAVECHKQNLTLNSIQLIKVFFLAATIHRPLNPLMFEVGHVLVILFGWIFFACTCLANEP